MCSPLPSGYFPARSFSVSPALLLIHAGDQDRLLSAFFIVSTIPAICCGVSPAVDHLRRSLTQLPVGIQLRNSPRSSYPAAINWLFLQFQDSVIHRQLACRHLFNISRISSMHNRISPFSKSSAACSCPHRRSIFHHLNFRADTAAESFPGFQVHGARQQKP